MFLRPSFVEVLILLFHMLTNGFQEPSSRFVEKCVWCPTYQVSVLLGWEVMKAVAEHPCFMMLHVCFCLNQVAVSSTCSLGAAFPKTRKRGPHLLLGAESVQCIFRGQGHGLVALSLAMSPRWNHVSVRLESFHSSYCPAKFSPRSCFAVTRGRSAG